MKALVVLSHLMSRDCVLGAESAARARLAIDKFKAENYEYFITIGWAYRSDCDTAISDVVKEFIIDNSDLDSHSVTSLSSSRDTVGDAYYCLDFFQNSNIEELHVVTSDYHVKRTDLIFKTLFNDKLVIKVFGAATEAINNTEILTHETKSIQAFENTFSQTNCADIDDIKHTMSIKHPFYNGRIYPKI